MLNNRIWKNRIMDLLEANLCEIAGDRDTPTRLSSNPNAISILEKNPDKINWSVLSRNRNALELLKKNPDKIDWHNLCGFKSSLDYLPRLVV